MDPAVETLPNIIKDWLAWNTHNRRLGLCTYESAKSLKKSNKIDGELKKYGDIICYFSNEK